MVFENLIALHISIRENCPPEIAFRLLDDYCEKKKLIRKHHFTWTKEDAQDVLRLSREGLKLDEIASFYGMKKSGLLNAVKRYLPAGTSFRGGVSQ